MLTSRWPNDACRTTSIKIRVWTSHLVMLDVRTLEQQTLTSGVSEGSNFF